MHEWQVPQVQAKLWTPLRRCGRCANFSGDSTTASADYGGNGGGSLISTGRGIIHRGGALGVSTDAAELHDRPLWREFEKCIPSRCAECDRADAGSSG